ncbi:MAG TPA: hypothetical protein VE287_10950, partial [Actinopolymorphaceae bacterium]|nr:hypothetical protein [Actinopolymorphaceae bacterium]
DVQLGLGWFYDTPIPAMRTHLTTTALGATPLPWANSLDVQQIGGPLWYTEMRDPAVEGAGSATTRSWGSAGLRPQGSGVRAGPMMDVRFEPFSGSEPGNPRIIVWNDDGISGEASLRREGTMAGHASKPFQLRSMPQPAQMSRFTLDLDAKRSVPWSRYATQVKASWDFTCDTPSTPAHAMRILNIRPTGDFDMYGRAPAGRSFRLDIPIDMVDLAGRVVDTTLMVSYDDGRTWANVTTTKDSNTRWHAVLTHPDKPGGFVSLRTAVTTDNGHKASLTTIRAYGLAPAG